MTNNMTIAKKNSRNKILVVGHEQSEYKSVLKLLNAGGMSLANPSVRDGMQADEISKTILKHFQNNSSEITQLSVSPVWNGLALDLMMANIDKPMWCWADPSSVSLLNYWKSLDSQLAFIFVYDSPSEFMLKNFTSTEPLSAEALKSKLNEWCLYNKALLDFYNRNKASSLLVNSQQINEDASGYLQYVENQTGIPLLTEATIQTDDVIDKLSSQEESVDRNSYKYLADDLLEQFPQVMELYEELESVANLPSANAVSLKTSAYDAWISLSNIQKVNQQTLKEKKVELEKSQQEKKSLHEKVRASEREKKEHLQESELLLTQLHTVQEELEKSYLKTQQTFKNKAAELEKIQQEKKNLDEKVRASASDKKDHLQNNKLLLRQLHTVQEELEQSYLKTQQTLKEKKNLDEKVRSSESEKKDHLQNNKLLLTQLHTVQEELEIQYIKNTKPKLYGAADQVKAQLSYRLGAAMIENSKSTMGFLKTPFTLRAEIKKFRLERSKTKGQKLPSLDKYSDADEAEKIKKHLSYRLGQAMLKNKKTPLGWVKLPFALKRAHAEYKIGRNL
jgi:myosin heavy subunit